MSYFLSKFKFYFQSTLDLNECSDVMKRWADHLCSAHVNLKVNTSHTFFHWKCRNTLIYNDTLVWNISTFAYLLFVIIFMNRHNPFMCTSGFFAYVCLEQSCFSFAVSGSDVQGRWNAIQYEMLRSSRLLHWGCSRVWTSGENWRDWWAIDFSLHLNLFVILCDHFKASFCFFTSLCLNIKTN